MSAEAEKRTPLQISLGRAIRRRRDELELTQDQLSEKTGIHRSAIAETERGSRNVAFANIVKISHGLDLQPSELMELFEIEADRMARQLEKEKAGKPAKPSATQRLAGAGS